MRRLLAAALSLSLAGCTIGQTRISFGLSVAADAGTTAAGLGQGASEANPALGKATIPAMLLLSGVVALVAEHAARNGEERKAARLYAVATVIHASAAIWNVTQLTPATEPVSPRAASGGPRGRR